MHFSADDQRFMQLAIELAKKGRFTTTPNPNVGSVLVKDGKIIGQGFHQQAGTPHAEIHALNEAGANAKGATAYVTLEPCSHTGRTGPCSQALINAGVSKVICAMQDPNPQVSGRGLRMLEQAGVETASGLLHEQAEQLNLGFLKRMRQGMPFVTCKLAASLDGKTALANGKSKWITGASAREDVHLYRAQHCAILTGADTVLTDNAQLNVRLSERQQRDYIFNTVRQPVRVVIDSRRRLTPELALFDTDSDIILVHTDNATELDKRHHWPNNVTHLHVASTATGQVDLKALLAELGRREINSVWLEAGAQLAGAMAEQALIDRYIVYVAPKMMGTDAKGLVNIGPFEDMNQVHEFEFSDVTQVGADVRLTLDFKTAD